MRQTDIVGLTLAELALVLLFAFLAITVPSQSRLRKTIDAQRGDIASLKTELAAASKERQALLNQNRALASDAKRVPPKLRSSAPPSCVEIGVAGDWLFTAVVRGSDSYEIDGQVLSLNDLLKRFDREISTGQDAGCFHTAKILFKPNIGASDYDYALRQLEQHFYTRKLGIQR